MSTPHLLAGFIGINRHLDPGISELNCAHRDATALWALWQDTLPDTTSVRLVDEEATCVRIEELLIQTLDAATEHDTVLLTFSGHGTHNHRLVAHDTSLAELAETTVSMASLAERFRRSKARHILLVLDCCFSEGAPAKVIEDGLQARGGSYSLEAAFTGRGRVLLAAANVEEEAWEAAGHGLLTAEVEVAGLLADVTGRVRAEAQRLGSILALPLLSVPTLTRGEILLLVSQGLTKPGSGWAVVESLATQLFGVARAQQLAAVWPLPPATE